MDSTRGIKSYDTRKYTIRRDNIGMVWRVLDHTIDMAREVSGRDDMRITLRRESDTGHFLRGYIMKSPHKHHIIPRYHCKKLGIDPDFDDNFVTIERIEHAQIHWEYYNGGYETLLKYIKPKPYVLMNIPFGDKRDSGGAAVIALGEIDGIDNIGENHPQYGMPRSEETKKKISIAHTGKKLTEETKEKLRIVRQKQLNDEEYLQKHNEGVKKAGLLRRGENNHNYGKPLTTETKRKLSETKIKFYEDNPNIGSTWSKHGEEHQSYVHGKLVNARNDSEVQRIYKAEWYQRNKKKITREQKDARNKKRRELRAKKKAEKQGAGTLDTFLK